jgi:hypothetical protein
MAVRCQRAIYPSGHGEIDYYVTSYKSTKRAREKSQTKWSYICENNRSKEKKKRSRVRDLNTNAKPQHVLPM